jgi:hypothetical protein
MAQCLCKGPRQVAGVEFRQIDGCILILPPFQSPVNVGRGSALAGESSFTVINFPGVCVRDQPARRHRGNPLPLCIILQRQSPASSDCGAQEQGIEGQTKPNARSPSRRTSRGTGGTGRAGRRHPSRSRWFPRKNTYLPFHSSGMRCGLPSR